MPLPTDQDTHADGDAERLAVLVACACVLQVAESLLPHPVPGVRFGLANLITLVALVRIGAGIALKITLLRTLVSSLILGTFLGPSFLLSLAGGLVSTGVTILLYRLSIARAGVRFSLVGISIAGSVVHVLTQVAVVYFLLVPNPGVWLLWPWLALSALVMGTVTGLIARQVCRRLDLVPEPTTASATAARPAFPQGQFSPGVSPLHRLRPEIKIVAAAAIAVALVFIRDLAFYGAVGTLLVVASLVGRLRAAMLVRGFKRLASLVVASFLIPVVFTPWGQVLLRAGPLTVTTEGLATGGMFALRLVLMFYATAVLAAVTSPEEISLGLERLLAPLRVVGVVPGGLALTLGLAWAYFPVLWGDARRLIVRRRRERWLERLIQLPGDVVVDLYGIAARTGAGVPPS